MSMSKTMKGMLLVLILIAIVIGLAARKRIRV